MSVIQWSLIGAQQVGSALIELWRLFRKISHHSRERKLDGHVNEVISEMLPGRPRNWRLVILVAVVWCSRMSPLTCWAPWLASEALSAKSLNCVGHENIDVRALMLAACRWTCDNRTWLNLVYVRLKVRRSMCSSKFWADSSETPRVVWNTRYVKNVNYVSHLSSNLTTQAMPVIFWAQSCVITNMPSGQNRTLTDHHTTWTDDFFSLHLASSP